MTSSVARSTSIQGFWLPRSVSPSIRTVSGPLIHIRRTVGRPAHWIVPPPMRVRLPPLSTESEFVSVAVPDKTIVSSPYPLAVQSL